MVNDTSTVAGALQECIDHLEDNLAAKGVTASYAPSTGMIGLIDEILNIQTGGSCYHIEFSEDSYVAVGGSATLEVYLQSNYQPLSGATVTVTGSDSSLYTGITNSNGVANVTVENVSGTVTFTCSYQNVSATCVVNGSSYLFRDGGVTGDKNTNYTKHSDVNVSTTSTGTTVSSVADCYPKCYSPNVTLSGDFEIEFTQLTNSNWWQLRVHFADTSNNVVDFAYLSGGGYNRLVTQNNGTKPDVGSSQNNGYANYTHTFPVTVKITRVGSTYSYYEDDDLKLTNTGTTNPVTFGFWSDDISRTVYKDLTIKAL